MSSDSTNLQAEEMKQRILELESKVSDYQATIAQLSIEKDELQRRVHQFQYIISSGTFVKKPLKIHEDIMHGIMLFIKRFELGQGLSLYNSYLLDLSKQLMYEKGAHDVGNLYMGHSNENFSIIRTKESFIVPIPEEAPPSNIRGFTGICISFKKLGSQDPKKIPGFKHLEEWRQFGDDPRFTYNGVTPKLLNFIRLIKHLLKDHNLLISNEYLGGYGNPIKQNLHQLLDICESFKMVTLYTPYLFVLNKPCILKSTRICLCSNGSNLDYYSRQIDWLLHPTREAKYLWLRCFMANHLVDLLRQIIQNFHGADTARTFFVVFERNDVFNNMPLPSTNQRTGETMRLTRIDYECFVKKLLLSRTRGAVPTAEDIKRSLDFETPKEIRMY